MIKRLLKVFINPAFKSFPSLDNVTIITKTKNEKKNSKPVERSYLRLHNWILFIILKGISCQNAKEF